jgi:DNA-binding beta-propeller fold protein YncE
MYRPHPLLTHLFLMHMLRPILVFVAMVFLLNEAQSQPKFALRDSLLIGGKAKWDYLNLDHEKRKLYVSHGDEIDVIDLTKKEVVARMGAHGSHGIAISHKEGHGFYTNGKSNSVSVFDLSDHSMIKETTVGDDPDAIAFDSVTSRVFAFNGHGASCSVIDAKSGDVIATIDLKGSPEFGLSDGAGHVYVNIEDKNETVEIDAKEMKVTKRWSLEKGEAPTGLSMDKVNRRLFVGCHNALMIVLNADNGKIEATLPIGKGVDATAFDPASMQAFSSNGDGTLTVVNERSPGNFSVSQNVATLIGGRTMAIDQTTHDIYIASAGFEVPLPPPGKKPMFIDGTFKIMRYGK